MTKREIIEKKQKLQDQIVTIINQNQDKIKVGDIYKNKAALFTALDIESKKGSQANAIEKVVKTVIDYEKLHPENKYDNQIIITEIYSEPKEIIDGREEKNGNHIYSKLIETILMIYMSENDQNVYYFTYPKIYQMLGMCNEYYHNYDIRRAMKKEDPRMTKFEVNTFFSESSSLMKKTLIRALNSMSNRSLINYSKEIVLVIDRKNNTKEYKVATEEEIQTILTVQREVLKSMNMEDLFSAYMSVGYMKFMRKVQKIIKEQYGWDGYFEQLKIITASKFCLDGAIEYDFEKLKNTLNENIQLLINNTNQTMIDRENKELEQNWEDYKQGIKELKGLYADYESYKKMNQKKPDTFLQLQSILVKLFISLAPAEEKEIFKSISEKLSKQGILVNGEIVEPIPVSD